jgi:predicted transcriptional regulator
MQLFIREVDPAAVKKIDELAKKQCVSRNTYLANLINNYAALEEFKSFEQRYQAVLKKSLNVIQQNSDCLEKFMEFRKENGNE